MLAPPFERRQGHTCSERKHLLLSRCMETVVATRVDKTLYAKIVKRQQAARKLTGIEPSISAVVRTMIAEAAPRITSPKRRRAKVAA